MNLAVSKAALALIGIPFRLHGREVAGGLDCVGLVGEVLRQAGGKPVLPEGYSLRLISIEPLLTFAERSGLSDCTVADDADVVLCRTNPMQPHLLIHVPGGFVHAHASLGKVVFMPQPLAWTVLRLWRFF
ncbi:MAG: peptidoglycan endopeptidase [Novosphingobium sp.]|jgi:hypothetical protein